MNAPIPAEVQDQQIIDRLARAGIRLIRRGKVRDTFQAGRGQLLLVVTDRISAFDCVLPSLIPDKGRVLNQLSAFWCRRFQDLVDDHLIASSPETLLQAHQLDPAMLYGRASIVRQLEMMPVECVVRGYLVGSGWKEYQRDGTVCGIRLREGLQEASKLPQPIFTPSTKAETGHDENIRFSEVEQLVGEHMAARLRDASFALYSAGADYALSKGIIIADTKFEFGRNARGELMLADEVLTPDSSRFWPAEQYQPGRSQPSFDKQFARDYLESLGWNKQPPAPKLPPEVIEGTRRRYLEVFERLTGYPLLTV